MIILDLDNVIADDHWRVPMILPNELDHDKKFHEYHLASIFDEPGNKDLWQNQPHGILLFTSRPEQYVELTECWLEHHRVPWEGLFMRAVNDHSSSVQVKRGMIQAMQHFGYRKEDIVCAYDDRQDVVDMYLRQGIPAVRRCIHEFEYPQVVI